MDQSEGPTEDQHAESPKQSKSRSGPDLYSLSRCADCYNHKANFKYRSGDNSESSSSNGDSGPEVGSDSEAESSSSSSCCTENPVEEAPERHSPVSVDAGEPRSGGQDSGRQQETSESQDGERRTKGMGHRAPLVKSLSLPTFVAPHLTPLSVLPRPRQVVSTLHLQVLPQKRNNNTFYTIRPSVREEATRRGAGINNLLPLVPSPWQQHPPHFQPQHFPPLTAQSQMLLPPLHTVPMLHTPLQAPNAPYAHLHALTRQPCWCRYCMSFPYPHWSHFNSSQLP